VAGEMVIYAQGFVDEVAAARPQQVAWTNRAQDAVIVPHDASADRSRLLPTISTQVWKGQLPTVHPVLS